MAQKVIVGGLSIWKRQVCCQGKHIVCFVPQLQLLQKHILLIPHRQVQCFSEFSKEQNIECGKMLRKLNLRYLQKQGFNSSTIHVQNASQIIKAALVHLIPRETGDLQYNDSIYDQLLSYHQRYNKIVMQRQQQCINLFEQARKVRQYMQTLN